MYLTQVVKILMKHYWHCFKWFMEAEIEQNIMNIIHVSSM